MGRRAELHEASRLLRTSPLVTLIGPGGGENTGMALRLAATAREPFSGDRAFVDLAERHETNLLVNAVADRLCSAGDLARRRRRHLLVPRAEHEVRDRAVRAGAALLDRATRARARQPARGARLLLIDRFLLPAHSTRSLIPFDDLTAKQRAAQPHPLAWLRSRASAPEVAAELDVHPQAIRYRRRQLSELFCEHLDDLDERFILEIALRAEQFVPAIQPGWRTVSSAAAGSGGPPT